MKKIVYTKSIIATLALVAVSLGAGSALGYGYGYGYGTTVTTTTTPTVVVPAKFMFMTNLGFGMKNAEVAQLQERLRAEGYFTFHTSTSYFGPITKAAVVAYQAAHAIPKTGFVGPLTRGALNM